MIDSMKMVFGVSAIKNDQGSSTIIWLLIIIYTKIRKYNKTVNAVLMY